MTVAGIPGGIADGTNKVKITVQTALTTGLKYVNGEMGEVQDT